FNQFSADFGFGYYNVDSHEANNIADGPKSIERLIGECSFSSSFLSKAVAAAKKEGFESPSAVFLLYDIDYRPKKTGVSRSKYMAFIGSFRYDPDSDFAFPKE